MASHVLNMSLILVAVVAKGVADSGAACSASRQAHDGGDEDLESHSLLQTNLDGDRVMGSGAALAESKSSSASGRRGPARVNTGCLGNITLLRLGSSTRDGCWGRFETEVYDPIYGGSQKVQPPDNEWFIVDQNRRRRQRWYCGNTKEKYDCGGGNCMKVSWKSSRRRFRVECGECRCNPIDFNIWEIDGDWISVGSIPDWRQVCVTTGIVERMTTEEMRKFSTEVKNSLELSGSITKAKVAGMTGTIDSSVTSEWAKTWTNTFGTERSEVTKWCRNATGMVYNWEWQWYLTVKYGDQQVHVASREFALTAGRYMKPQCIPGCSALGDHQYAYQKCVKKAPCVAK